MHLILVDKASTIILSKYKLCQIAKKSPPKKVKEENKSTASTFDKKVGKDYKEDYEEVEYQDKNAWSKSYQLNQIFQEKIDTPLSNEEFEKCFALLRSNCIEEFPEEYKPKAKDESTAESSDGAAKEDAFPQNQTSEMNAGEYMQMGLE